MRNYPQKGQCGFRETHGPSVVLQAERAENIRARKACEVCGKPYSENARFELHHRDGNRRNNDKTNFLWCCVSCHKKAHYSLGRTRQMERGYPVSLERITAIEFMGEEDVYDIEMAEPAHNFVVDSNIVTSNSHAVCVALDSLYGAWLKAHHPLEYYATLLSGYAQKGDKDRIARVKAEMKRAFDIRIAPCRFRQDNRDFYIDHASNTISDALTSIKHIGQRTAQKLCEWRDRPYSCFTDLLCDMALCPAFDSRAIEILIRLDYFREFGKTGRLLRLFGCFQEGELRFSKAHVESTQQKRLAALRELESHLEDVELPLVERLRFETEHLGTPLTLCPQERALYVVLDVDPRYSPRLRLYSVATGNVGEMKIKKALFNQRPLASGDVLRLRDWQRRPVYSFAAGRPRPVPGKTEPWLLDYEVLADSPQVSPGNISPI